MRIFLRLLFIVFFFNGNNHEAQAQNGSGKMENFWSMQEYEALHPEQKSVAAAFSKRVVGPAEALPRDVDPVRIAVVYPGLQVSDYWRRSVVSFEARLREIGLPYVIESHFPEFGQAVTGQAELIKEVLEADPDYLVFTLDALQHQTIVQRLIAKGRPKVILQNITTPMKAWGKRQPFFYVGFDHVAGTELLIEYYRERFGKNMPFAILYGPRGYVSRARGSTFVEAYADETTENLKASYYIGYDREKSRKAASAILQEHKHLAFIYACSTDIALGVLDAVVEKGLAGKIITNGWGGGSAELDAVLDGTLDVTVMRMNDDNGIAMAEAISLDRNGRSGEVPLVYSGSFELVTSADPAERIEALKKRAFRYSK
jgi:autoinducer 2-binding protein LuxP